MNDFFQCKDDKQILQLLAQGENIILSTLIIKFNHVNKQQERIILVTNLAIYNIGKSSIFNNLFSMIRSSSRLKRRISLENIKALTVSRCGYQFVIHVINQHDYRYSSTDKKNLVVQAICLAYCNYNKKKLAFYFTDDLILSKCCTTKGDLKEKKNRQPKQNPQYLDPQSLKNNENARSISQTVFSRTDSEQIISIQSFDMIKVLGKGSNGKVLLCQMKGQSRKDNLFAIKCMKKQNIIQKQQIQKTKTERKILQEVAHPFLVSLQYSFQTKQRLFFVMKYIRGGDLLTHLNTKKKFSQQLTKFYIAQIVIALDYLHSKNYIYRDLKPENILLNEDGYVALTDFGISKSLEKGQKAYTFAGTPQYMAPQIIKFIGHNKSVDWWSVGILVYQMLVGVVPFYHQNQNILFHIIIQKDLVFKQDVILSQNAKKFIQQLLIKNPSLRLGNKSVQQIKNHAWFHGIEWNQILEKKVKPPYIPNINKQLDIQRLSKQYVEQQSQLSLPQGNRLLMQKFESQFSNMDFNLKAHSK